MASQLEELGHGVARAPKAGRDDSRAGAAERTVEEIMVPRTEILAYPIQTEPAELLERVLEERYTRVPVYEDSIDHVLGAVHLKDLIKLVRDGGTELQSILKPINAIGQPDHEPS